MLVGCVVLGWAAIALKDCALAGLAFAGECTFATSCFDVSHGVFQYLVVSKISLTFM